MDVAAIRRGVGMDIGGRLRASIYARLRAALRPSASLAALDHRSRFDRFVVISFRCNLRPMESGHRGPRGGEPPAVEDGQSYILAVGHFASLRGSLRSER
jgi:hypothetical protein